MVSQARADAVTSPAILRHALAIRDTVASSPAVAGPTCRPYPRPVVWPHLKKCDICKDLQAQKYCSSCKSRRFTADDAYVHHVQHDLLVSCITTLPCTHSLFRSPVRLLF